MIQYALLRLLMAASLLLPGRVLIAGANVLGTLAWYLVPRLREVTMDHMRHALGPLASRRKCARAARGCVRSAARYYIDLVHGPLQPPDRQFDAVESIDGLAALFAATERSCGAIVVSAHVGCPESMMRAFGHLGLNLMVLTEPLRPPRLHALVHALRAAPGVRVVPVDLGGMRTAVAHLRAGGVLALLADRDVLGTGRAVSFFGERALLPAGAVELSLRTGAPLLPGFVLRGPHGGVRITIEQPLPRPRRGDRAADVAAGHQLLAAALEQGIARAPEQWFALRPIWAGLAR